MVVQWFGTSDSKKTHALFSREVLYNSALDFGMKLIRLHTMFK
jgi:hypothetical protein